MTNVVNVPRDAAHADGAAIETSSPVMVADYPARVARTLGDKDAISFRGRSITYAALDQAADRFVTLMRSKGISSGQRLAWLGKNSDLFFVALFGCCRGGWVLTPISFRCAPAEVAFILDDSGAALVVHDESCTSLLAGALTLAAASPEVITVAALAANLKEHAVAHPSPRHDDPQAIVLQMYTSGTTGRAKGVLLSHRALSLMRHLEGAALEPVGDWSSEHVLMSILPIAHVAGVGWLLIGLRLGMSCVLTDDPSAANIVALMRHHRVTHILMVPTVIRAVIETLESSGLQPPSLRVVHYGASPMDVDLLRKCITLFGCHFGQHFGMTEVSGTVVFLGASDHDPSNTDRLRSLGRPLPGMSIEIRDAAGRTLKPNQPGEIWVQTPALMSGYWQLPDMTAAAVMNGWYRTGDGGYLDQEGYLYLTDRIKDIIITGGENVYPVEVETILRQHPAVQDVAVVGIADDHWGEAVTAVIEWAPGSRARSADLRAFVRARLSAFKCPKQIKSIDRLPRTSVGKVQRKRVAEEAPALPSVD